MSDEVLIADLECDSLRPSTIHMVGVLCLKTDQFTDYNGDRVAEGLVRIAEAKQVIFYNGLGYDVPVIERLTDGLVTFERERIIECLDLSRKLVKMKNHKLITWGDVFDFPKGDYHDFTRYTPEMSVYCERDCRLTKKVFEFLNEFGMEQGSPNLLFENQ